MKLIPNPFPPVILMVSPQAATGQGFQFTKPFTYDGMVFGGKEEFVRCAEGKQSMTDISTLKFHSANKLLLPQPGGIHYGVCSKISICLRAGTTHHDYVEVSF